MLTHPATDFLTSTDFLRRAAMPCARTNISLILEVRSYGLTLFQAVREIDWAQQHGPFGWRARQAD